MSARSVSRFEKASDAGGKKLLQSKVYERALKKLRKDKPWDKFDAIMAFAEWGLTRKDIGKDIDDEVFGLIQSTGFKMLCGEPYLLRNLVKLGYDQEERVQPAWIRRWIML